MTSLKFNLQCCGREHDLIVNEDALQRGELIDVRRNIVCPNCDKIVIIEIHPLRIIQEVLD